MNKQLISQTANLVQAGRLTECIQKIQKQLIFNINDYSLLSNLSAIYLQTGQYREAIKYSKKAISVDPYTHIAYFNRFLAYFSLGELSIALRDLQKALSCLYLLRGLEDSNIKFLNKSIQYCQQNARTYLVRAKLNQGKNNKLVQNDYSAALQYHSNLAEIYQQRALYFRRQNRIKQFQEDLLSYKQLKNTAEIILQQILDNQQQKIDESVNLKEKIEEKVLQFQQLLKKSQKSKRSLTQSAQYEEAIGKLPLNSLQSKIDKKDDDQLLLSDRPDESESTKTITIKKQEINFKKRPEDFKIDRMFKDIFQDQSSKELNQKISQLQREIQQQGGKIFLEKEDNELDVSDPSNYLTAELQKAIKEIQTLGAKQNLNEVKSAKSANSNGSIGSKLSEPRELTLEQFAKYETATIEIVSLQQIQNYNNKQTAKIELRYQQRKYQTQMSKYEWRQQFKMRIYQKVTQIQVKGIQKGGIFRDNFEIGEGTINLLETSINRCILANKQKKTAILYYKLSLN